MIVLFYVQHLLGIGHVRRAALLTEALLDQGFAVTVAYGGFPVPGQDFPGATMVQLPPTRVADASFADLLGEDGRPVGAAWRADRRSRLLTLFDRLHPDILLTETFPFGRRMFRFELEPLLERARARRPRPLVAASVRDVLVVKDNPAKRAWMARAARRWYDLVLVHGDPALVSFSASFPEAATIADLIHETGYVAPGRNASSMRAQPADRADDDGLENTREPDATPIVVSAGGGAVGGALLRAAVAARPLCRKADGLRWRLLVGPDLPAVDLVALREAAGADPLVVIEPARPDFPALLQCCRLSISQAGYNTVMDVLAAGCRALLVPFSQKSETEQRDRAALLRARGLAEVVEEAALTPSSLAAAVDRVLTGPAPPRAAIAMDGAVRSAAVLRRYRAALTSGRDGTGLPGAPGCAL